MSIDDIESLSNEFFVLWIMIAQTKDGILKAREREYARFNISNARRAILWDIQNSGGHATPVEISRQLFREIHSVTEILNRMEDEGLITRCKGSGRSKVEVRLTKKGQDIFDQSLYNETDRRIFSVLTKKQRERLALYLWKLRGKVCKELGILEWHVKFPLDPNNANNNQSQGGK